MKFKHKLLWVSLAALCIPASSVFAWGPGTVVVGAYDTGAAQQFKGFVTEAATIPITKVFAQVTDGLKTALISSNAEIATQMEQRQVNAAKLQEKLKVQKNQQPAVDACGSQSLAAFSGSVLDLQKSIASSYRAGGRTRAGNAPSSGDQQIAGTASHRETYCNKDTDPKKCSDVTPASPGREDADVKPESLFDGSGSNGGKVKTEDLSFGTTQILDAKAYINQSIDNGDSPRRLSAVEFDTDAGRKYEGLRIAYEARIGMSRGVLSDVLASRTPIQGSSNILKAIKDGSPMGGTDFITEREAKIKANKDNTSGLVSPMELLDIEVERRVSNPAWYESIDTSSDQVSLLREQTMMMALMLKMQYRTFRQNEIAGVVNAIQSAESVKANMRPKLIEAERGIANNISK